MIPRRDAWFVHIATLLVGATGVVYAVMRYLLEPSDPYSVVNHPWQPALQHGHVVTAPLLIFAVGLIWHRHVRNRLQIPTAPRRRSGITLALTILPMALSGVLIQVTVDERWRQAWVVTHVLTGGLWILAYAIHQLGKRIAPPGGPANG